MQGLWHDAPWKGEQQKKGGRAENRIGRDEGRKSKSKSVGRSATVCSSGSSRTERATGRQEMPNAEEAHQSFSASASNRSSTSKPAVRGERRGVFLVAEYESGQRESPG